MANRRGRNSDAKRTRLSFTLETIAGFTSLGRIGLLLQSSLKAVGIELAIKSSAYRTLFDAPKGPIFDGSFDLALFGDLLNWDPDLYDALACDRWYPAGQNIYRFCDPRLDALERAGLQSDDPSQRAAIYRKASRLIWSEVPYVPVYGGRSLIVHSSDLHNYSVSQTGSWRRVAMGYLAQGLLHCLLFRHRAARGHELATTSALSAPRNTARTRSYSGC